MANSRVSSQVVQRGDPGATYGGHVVEGNVTVEEAISLSGLDWDVALEPVGIAANKLPDLPEDVEILETDVRLGTGNREVIPGVKALYYKSDAPGEGPAGRKANIPIGLADPGIRPIEGFFANVRQDTRTVLGVVKSRYEPLQNKQAFDWIENFLGEDGAAISSAGALYGGRLVWVCVDLGGFDVVAGDEVRKHMLIMNSHDGTSNLVVQMLPQRVVCQNILNFHGSKDGVESFKIRHSRGMIDKFKTASEVFHQAHESFDRVESVFDKFAKAYITAPEQKELIYLTQSVTNSELRDFAQSGQRYDDEKEYKQPQWVNTTTEIERAIEVAPGSEFAKGTVWSVYNGLTYYFDWLRHVRGSEKKPDSIIQSKINGYSAQMKIKAFEVCYAATRK